jgi:hypothetical protein
LAFGIVVYMIVAVVGSRGFSDYALLKEKLDYFAESNSVSCVVSGGAKGADSLAARWATERGIQLLEFLPDWEKHGKSAGVIRNSQIIEKADVCVAFWDGKSRGTAHSISLARSKGVRLLVYGSSCE